MKNRYQYTFYKMDIEKIKVRRMIKNLDKMRGNGTSMITLIIPPKTQISQYRTMLTTEYGTASNIKSRVNRLSVLSAITSTQHILKGYKTTPVNGLVIFCGLVETDEGREKKVSIHFEPYKPIQCKKYVCDSSFHTEDLGGLIQDDTSYGFIIVNGKGSLYGVLSGNAKRVLHEFKVQLPNKHGRGGQSALRFQRLREEAIENYIRKVNEKTTGHYISNEVPNVKGLVLAGSANLKDKLFKSLDSRLKNIVIMTLDLSYGSRNGFHEAIEKSSGALSSLKLNKERDLLIKYFQEIALDTGKICFDHKDTILALDMGAVKTLIIWENYDKVRYVLENGDVVIANENKEIENVIEKDSFLDWLLENYQNYGTELEIVSDSTAQGDQFVHMGGIGGLLRYKVDFVGMEVDDEEDLCDEMESMEMSDYLSDLEDFL